MSFYTSLNGLKNAQVGIDVISNNIANANTDGFKSSTTSFADIISNSVTTDPALTVGLGSRVRQRAEPGHRRRGPVDLAHR